MPDKDGLLVLTDIDLKPVGDRPEALSLRRPDKGPQPAGHIVDMSKVKKNMETLSSQLNTLMAPLAGFKDFYVDTIELSIAITASGEIGIIVSKAEIGVTGGITITFKNKKANPGEG